MRERYSLADFARQRGDRRKFVALRPINAPDELIRRGTRIDMRVIDEWEESVERILDVYEAALRRLSDSVTDAAGDDIRSMLDRESERISRVVVSLDTQLNTWGISVEEWHRTRFTGNVRASVGVDVFPFLSFANVEDEVIASMQYHSSLIRGLHDDMRRRVDDSVWRGFLNQTDRRTLGKELQGQLNIGRTRANLIARDQTLKLSGKLEELRQREAGIDQYIWRTAEDERVRASHAARNKKVYRWDGKHIHPRQEINCRCTGQAYLDLTHGEDVPVELETVATPRPSAPLASSPRVATPRPRVESTPLPSRPSGSPIRIDIRGGWGEGKAAIKRAVEAIPRTHFARIQDVEIYSEKIVEWSRGDPILGLFEVQTRMAGGKLQVRRRIRIANTFKGKKLLDLPGTTTHELGHALDDSMRGQLAHRFGPTVEKNSRSMTSAQRYRARHYFSGPDEMFAELYKLLYSPARKGAFGLTQTEAETIFEESLQLLRDLQL